MNEFIDALYDKLAGTVAVTNLLSASTAIYEAEAPRGASLPYIIVNLQGGPGDEPANPDRHVNHVFAIKGVSATSIDAAGAIAAAIDGALHNAALTVSGWAVFWLARESPLRYTEHAATGLEVHHAGATYRIRAGT